MRQSLSEGNSGWDLEKIIANRYGQVILVPVQEEGGSVTAPGRPTEGAPSPQRLGTPHGGVGGSWQLEEPQCLPSGFSPAEQRLQMPLEVGWLWGR